MSRSRSMFDNIRNTILLVLVIFVSVLFTGFIIGPVITVLYFLVMRFYRRSKDLERQLAELRMGTTKSGNDYPPPSAVPPSPSTDA